MDEATPATANFDRVARLYRWGEYLLLGPLLSRTRRRFLREVAHAHRAWVFGDGDGRFLAALLQETPTLSAVAVDASATMLQLLGRRCARDAARVQTVQADVLALCLDELGPEPDLVVTHFFLDCFQTDQVNTLVQAVTAHLTPGALWLVSDFATPAQQPWRALGKALIRSLYLSFHILTGLRVRSLPDTTTAFLQAGFRRVHHASWCRGLLFSEVWLWEGSPKVTPGTAPTQRLTAGRSSTSM